MEGLLLFSVFKIALYILVPLQLSIYFNHPVKFKKVYFKERGNMSAYIYPTI